MVPVLWFLGLSASGKTTLAIETYNFLTNNRSIFPQISKWEMLDGDVIRTFLGDEVGYTFDDRRKSVKIMGLVAKKLADNGVGVIVANISPFYDIRMFLRENIKNYYEIYCKCSIEECIKRDPKNNYKLQFEKGLKNYIGIDIPFQEPTNSDLILDTQRFSETECMEQIINYFSRISLSK